MVELSLSETTVGVRKLEGPQEVVSLLEVGANGDNLVDQVLDGGDTVLAKSLLNDGVLRQSNSLLVDLTVTSLVDQLSDGSSRGVTVSNVGLNQLQQLGGSLGDTHENTGVDLGQTQQLQDLSGLRGDLHHTLDSNNENQLGLGLDVVVAVSLSLSLGIDDGTLSLVVLLLVSSSTVVVGLSLGGVSLFKVSIFFSPERWLTK